MNERSYFYGSYVPRLSLSPIDANIQKAIKEKIIGNALSVSIATLFPLFLPLSPNRSND